MNYDINSIEHLSFREGIRERVQMYLGSDDTEGIYQGFKEIINNSTDEALAGFGDRIEINVNEKENKITIRDYGRGVPFGIREDGENVLVSIYTESHTGGKFGKGVYQNSSGLNGMGGSAVCLSSERFLVESYRDGKFATFSCKKGITPGIYTEGDTREKNGTLVSFIPDKEVFKNMTEGYSFQRICKEIKNIAYLNKGVHFVITCEDTKETTDYYSENGIIDFIQDCAEKPLMQPIICTAADDVDEIEVAFMWTSGREASYVFVNGLLCPEGGSPITGAKTTITQQIKKLGGDGLDGDLIRKGLVYAINCKVAQPSFANQTKTKINNPNLRTLASKAFKEGLDEFARTSDCDLIINMLLKFQKAEKAADRARKQILETAKEIEKNATKKVFNTDKLKDAEFLGQNSTLLIVEGNSAMGSIAQARDYTKYGILAIRGKMINPLSNSEEKVAENEEIRLLLKALNIVPGKYDAKKLRYGKVGICVDADSDGSHIALLIMSVLHYLAPQFLKEGRLCWLRSPLYIVQNGKQQSYYFTDEEFNNVRATIKGEVTRAKGLGELDADVAKNSMFNEKNQRIDKFIWNDESTRLLCDLMGDDPELRKKFIFENVDFSTVKE